MMKRAKYGDWGRSHRLSILAGQGEAPQEKIKYIIQEGSGNLPEFGNKIISCDFQSEWLLSVKLTNS